MNYYNTNFISFLIKSIMLSDIIKNLQNLNAKNQKYYYITDKNNLKKCIPIIYYQYFNIFFRYKLFI